MYDEDEDPEFDESSDAEALDGEVEVSCPYCGEIVSIAIDAGGGEVQDYVQDCEVCCQPWRVHVTLRRGGSAHVHLDKEDDEG
jgi:hypothetical protein